MWSAPSEDLTTPRGRRFTLSRDARPATVAEVIAAWQDDAAFRSQFNALLAGAPDPSFRWELPPVTSGTISRPFGCVLLDSPELSHRPDPTPFDGATTPVVAIPNLGRDAILVDPCPLTDPSAYPHLATFVRLAPSRQQHALWQSVGAALARRLGTTLVWLSTAGAGVPWLHVRLDDRPKYSVYAPYRRTDEEPGAPPDSPAR